MTEPSIARICPRSATCRRCTRKAVSEGIIATVYECGTSLCEDGEEFPTIICLKMQVELLKQEIVELVEFARHFDSDHEPERDESRD